VTPIRCIRRREAAFPALLAAIHDPPPQLYLRGAGDFSLFELPSVAIVGARACSSYGRSVARSLARELAAAGLAVVSGMARGIDGEAHRGALDGGGSTVAVLGCGVDRNYPAAHAELARRICEAGLVVSEYEPGVEPAPWRFPARNRIIAGPVATSWTRHASGAGAPSPIRARKVAMPRCAGRDHELPSAGTNALPVSCDARDARRTLEGSALAGRRAASLGMLLDALLRGTPQQRSYRRFVRASGVQAAQSVATLVELELAGRVTVEDGVYRAAL
jgi:DNA protecting protein DprA